MQSRIACYGATDVGRHRSTNQDQFLIADLAPALQVRESSLEQARQSHFFGEPRCKVLIIADGMGGHAAGERASTLALNSAVRFMLSEMRWEFLLDPSQKLSLESELAAAVEFCQAEMVRETRNHPERYGMGTTLTLACIFEDQLFVAHVGDSRCYLWRNGQLRQITRDHTMAQHFIDGGALDPHHATASPWSSVLWNVVGGGSRRVEPELKNLALEPGDKLLLCSDGLTRHVAPDRIAAVLSRPAPEEICSRLIDEANQGGGTDNITVVVASLLPSARPAGARTAEFPGNAARISPPRREHAPFAPPPAAASTLSGLSAARAAPQVARFGT
jgi:protein phosphatase